MYGCEACLAGELLEFVDGSPSYPIKYELNSTASTRIVRRPQYSEVRSMTKRLRWDLRMPKLAEVNALRETSRGVGLLELAIRGHPR